MPEEEKRRKGDHFIFIENRTHCRGSVGYKFAVSSASAWLPIERVEDGELCNTKKSRGAGSVRDYNSIKFYYDKGRLIFRCLLI